MTVYSFYVFDRHCTCVYFASFSPKPPRQGPTTLPNVYRANLLTPPASTAPVAGQRDSVATSTSSGGDRNSIVAPWDKTGGTPVLGATSGEEEEVGQRGGLAFDEEAKLVYGIVFSLRNMVKKLSGRDEDSFHSFSTSTYKLHYLSTPTLSHFILLSNPTTDSLRPVLQRIVTGPYMDYVVRNPMVEVDSNVSGKGIDSDAFRGAVERILLGQ